MSDKANGTINKIMIEENLAENLKQNAYHPSLYVYAWKRKDLDKLFDEFLKSNIAITSGEAWMVNDDLIESIIPLQNGDMDIFNWKCERKKVEEWFDFVERSIKETTELISNWNLEKHARLDRYNNIWYHLELSRE